MEIKGLMMSLIDYPGNVCITLFTGGCNYRCPFCQNSDLVLAPEKLKTIEMDSVLEQIKKRKNMIDGVTITGGEPLMNSDLQELLVQIRGMGLKTKLDTNGSFSDSLGNLLSQDLLSYVAMDIKTSPEKYDIATGVKADFGEVKKSAELLRSSPIDYEFRTTVVPKLVEKKDIEQIGEWLKGAKNYYLQQFVPDNSLSPQYKKIHPYPPDEINEFAKIAERYFLNVGVRGL